MLILRGSLIASVFVLCAPIEAEEVVTTPVVTKDSNACECGCGPYPEVIRVSHREPKGIGYNKGYTSLDFLITSSNFNSKLVQFLDARGHVFNDGKPAVNAGVGARWLATEVEKVLGINFFYDYRLTSKRPYHQVACGIETLGIKWDFRFNGYLTVGNKRSRPFDFEFELFPDNSFLITAKREFSMRGVDAEFGYHFDKLACDNIEIYAALGPYFYSPGKFGKNATGGRLRGYANLYTYLTLEANVSYDHVFHWIGQGAVALNFPFGPREDVKKRKFCSCCDAYALQERLYQPIWHNEIIVVDRHRQKL